MTTQSPASPSCPLSWTGRILWLSVFAVVLELGLILYHGGLREYARQALLPVYYHDGLSALAALPRESSLLPGTAGFRSLARLVEECGVLYPLGRPGEDIGPAALAWVFNLLRRGERPEPRAIQRIELVDSSSLLIAFDRGVPITLNREQLRSTIKQNPPPLSLTRVMLGVCAALLLHGVLLHGAGAVWRFRTKSFDEKEGAQG